MTRANPDFETAQRHLKEVGLVVGAGLASLGLRPRNDLTPYDFVDGWFNGSRLEQTLCKQ